jgi:hypothetical protein
MRHKREEVIERTIHEFELLDHLVSNMTLEEWDRLLPRPEGKDPWTVKDALAHITHWKANTLRSIKHLRRPAEERGLETHAANHLIYIRWHLRPTLEVLDWHRQVQQELLAALRDAPDSWFSGRERREEWPYDLDGHSAYHRIKDIERVLKG